jgi:hypothetical protein
MKPARAELERPRIHQRGEFVATVVRRASTSARRQRLVHLLAVLLDKPDTPDDGGRR